MKTIHISELLIYLMLPTHALLISVPVRDMARRFSPGAAVGIFTAIAALASAAVLSFELMVGMMPGFILLVFFLLLFFVYRWLFEFPTLSAQLLRFFWGAAVSTYVFSSATPVLELLLYEDAVPLSIALRVGTLLALVTAMIGSARHRDQLNEERVHSPTLQSMALIYSALIFYLLYLLYFGVLRERGSAYTGLVMTFQTFLFAMYITLYITYNLVSSELSAMEALRTDNEFKRISEQEYAHLLHQIERVRRQQHDYRHAMRTLSAMLDEGDLEAVRTYLDGYSDTLGPTGMETWCLNAPVNAVLSYYIHLARTNGIHPVVQVVLPEASVVPDSMLCSLIGNALENAVDGCMTLPQDQREMAVNIFYKDAASLFITVSNSFDGKVSMKDGDYLTTKPRGTGTGCRSMTYTAQSLGGSIRFYHTEREFFVEVYIPVVPSEPKPM